MPLMLGSARHQIQILGLIVLAIPIYVVNILLRQQGSTDLLRQYQPVLFPVRLGPLIPKQNISIGIHLITHIGAPWEHMLTACGHRGVNCMRGRLLTLFGLRY